MENTYIQKLITAKILTLVTWGR